MSGSGCAARLSAAPGSLQTSSCRAARRCWSLKGPCRPCEASKGAGVPSLELVIAGAGGRQGAAREAIQAMVCLMSCAPGLHGMPAPRSDGIIVGAWHQSDGSSDKCSHEKHCQRRLAAPFQDPRRPGRGDQRRRSRVPVLHVSSRLCCQVPAYRNNPARQMDYGVEAREAVQKQCSGNSGERPLATRTAVFASVVGLTLHKMVGARQGE